MDRESNVINPERALTSVKSVLICEAAPIPRTRIKNKLKDLGVEVIVECCDLMSVVSTATATLPNIVILDIATARKKCLNAAREIRQKLKIPVVLLMSFCDPGTLNRARKIGITTILLKPFRGRDLLPAMEIALAHAEEVELLKRQAAALKTTINIRKIIDKAKEFLQRSHGISEPVAYRKIQKLAMDSRKSMRQIAEEILITAGVQHG